MGKYLIPLIVLLALSIFSFFPRQLGLLAGEMGVYTGTLSYQCSEPIKKIVFQLGPKLGDALMVYEEPTGWNYTHAGDRIQLEKENGLLDADVPIQLTVSCKWYMGKDIYKITSIGTTSTRQTVTTQGDLEIPDMMALQILFHLTNPLVRVAVFGATLVFLFLEIRSRQSTSAAPASDPGQDPYVV